MELFFQRFLNFGGFGKYSRGTPFYYASNLYLNGELVTEYTFPEGTTTIRNMFYGVKCLTKVTIPDGVTKIDSSAFANCTGLTNIELPETVTQIGEMAFSGCSGLNSMTLPKNVKSIGNDAFSGCSALTSFEIPEGITTIGMDTFSACSNLASITIPKSVTSIAQYAFWGSNNLTDIYYGGSQATWANVKNHTGSDNGSLTSAKVHFVEANEPCGDDLLWEYDEANHILTIRGIGPMYNYTEQSRPPWDTLIYWDVKQIIVEEGVTTIGDYAFEGAWTPAKASLPESLVSIGAYAFQDCFYLKDVSIPDSVTEIKDYAFHACGFTKISVPSKLQKIGSYVFYSCDALTEVTIPDTLTFLGEGMSSYCSALPAINIPEGITAIPGSFCSYCENLTTVTIPSTVVTIGSDAFLRCSKLSSINIPEGVSEILYSAFSSCTNLKSVALPSTLQTIGPSAFSYCTQLAEIVIPDGVTSIGSSTFGSCSNLTNVSIPSSVTSIGASAFSYCEKLTSITLPKSVTVIANNTFGNCTALTDVYYTGTEEQWAELLASTDPEYNAPLFNEELQVHCNIAEENDRGFSAQIDGWSFCNTATGFGYSDDYAIPAERYEIVFGKSYVATAKAADKKVYKTMMPEWGGNCLGMATTAVLFYLGMLDWQEWNVYKDKISENVNDYYTNSGYYSNLFSSNYKTALTWSTRSSPITELIECYQILFNGSARAYTRALSTIQNLDAYMENGADGFGLVGSFKSKNHLPEGNYIATLVARQC